MHSQPMAESQGEFQSEWKPTIAENPNYACRKCGSKDVHYRQWDSDCGGYEDVQYWCKGCNRKWWVEGPDA